MYITPCLSICNFDSHTGVCIGCKRTKEQVDNWSSYTYEERMAVMKELGYGKRSGRHESQEERMRRYDHG